MVSKADLHEYMNAGRETGMPNATKKIEKLQRLMEEVGQLKRDLAGHQQTQTYEEYWDGMSQQGYIAQDFNEAYEPRTQMDKILKPNRPMTLEEVKRKLFADSKSERKKDEQSFKEFEHREFVEGELNQARATGSFPKYFEASQRHNFQDRAAYYGIIQQLWMELDRLAHIPTSDASMHNAVQSLRTLIEQETGYDK